MLLKKAPSPDLVTAGKGSTTTTPAAGDATMGDGPPKETNK